MAEFEVRDPRFDSASGAPAPRPPEDLPPVEPPSAGFIIQLFLIPALIVMAVVGVWALFGRIAGGEPDWRSLMAELKSGNEHRRWRAALGLAQVLKGDQEKGDQGQGLARNPQVGQELSALLKEQMAKPSAKADDLKQQAFLARTLGFMDVPEVVLPTLSEATQPTYDVDVRRNALASIALVLGRANERDEHPADADLIDRLITSTQDAELQIRQLGAYSLGLIPAENAYRQLELLAASESEEATVRANAAVGLARQHRKNGLPIFRKILQGSAEPKSAEGRQYVDYVTVRNTIKAVETLRNDLSAAERDEFAGLLKPVAENYPDDRIRLDAKAARNELLSVEPRS